MLSALFEIHWFAVAAATIASFIMGGLYFMVLVPRQYLYVTGRENLPKEQQAVSGPIFMVGPLVCSLITIIANAYLIQALGLSTATDAAMLGLIVGVGFLVPMTFNIAINPLFPRPIQYGLLNTPYFLVSNIVACILLALIPF
ncbi:hypothetical protein QO004_004983 [Rhizobium mesoamericanum]|uniref:DUF1761 domain-containing protein n=1 Tax=Rhizobium mesoamericanum TaxID=1079800 RepID=UPI00278425AB|nr:DUF1761 domain-containing protein [Rhizobium mesoamericanum]MDQ0563174.1 hypothetical protein [Rhizobium mesoamericanum]